MRLSVLIPALPYARLPARTFLAATASVFLSLSLAASEPRVTVPGAVRAIEQYEEAVEEARNSYRVAEEQAAGRWDEKAFFQRATGAYQQEMEEATTELNAELKRIEDWLLEQVELMREVREAAEDEQRKADAGPIYGDLLLVVKGRLDVYLNGVSVASLADPNNTHQARKELRVKPGDLLVFSARSPAVYRSFRAAFAVEDGAPLFINHENVRRIDKAVAEEITVEDFEAGSPASTGRSESGMNKLWNEFRLRNDASTWIRLPDRGGPYHFAFRVPAAGA